MGISKAALLVVLIGISSGCAVVTYNRYNISNDTENGVAWQSLEGHDMDVGLIKADLDSANANIVFSKQAGNPAAPLRMDMELYNHTKLLWMPANNAGRLALDGQMVNLQGGSTNANRRLELQDSGGSHQDAFFDINEKNEKAAFKFHSSPDISTSATEHAIFSLDRATAARICKAQKAQIQVWNRAGEYCTFVFPQVFKDHLATFLAAP